MGVSRLFRFHAKPSAPLRLAAGAAFVALVWHTNPSVLSGESTLSSSGETILRAFDGVSRASRAVYAISSIVVDYKYSLRGLPPGSSDEISKLPEVHLRAAKRLLKLCEANGGFYVKAGQFVSSLRHVPKEYSLTLSSLQDQAKPCNIKNIKEVIFKSLGEDSSKLLDEKTIELLFAYNMHCSSWNEESKSKNSPPSKQVIEHKRLQNFTILLKALNATAEQVCNALMLGSGLGARQLEALAKMVPTKEEEEKISKYEGDIEELGSTENFLKVILSIPLAFSRIEVMLYKETSDDEVIHLTKSFAILEEACKELRSSRLFLRLLEAVLKTGNRMNVGTIRGGARAFKLDALLKLADVKGTDGKTTLLHFVVQEMNKSEGPNTYEKTLTKSKAKNTKEKEEDHNARELELVSTLSSELCNVKRAATMDLNALASSVSNLSKGMSKLKEVVGDLARNERDVSFVSSMRSFKKQGDGVIKELQDSEDQVFRHVREITEYYHGDVSKDEVNPLRIFVIVSDFLGMLDRVCKELRSSKSPQPLNLIVSLARGF